MPLRWFLAPASELCHARSHYFGTTFLSMRPNPSVPTRPLGKAPKWAVALAIVDMLLRPGTNSHGKTERLPVARSLAGGATPDKHGRGRNATTPSDIPAKGWKDILWMAFYVLLSI